MERDVAGLTWNQLNRAQLSSWRYSLNWLCWETTNIKSQAKGTVMPLPCFQHLKCALYIFFSQDSYPFFACTSILSNGVWKHALSIVTMLTILKPVYIYWTPLSPDWNPTFFWLVWCGFFLRISSWTVRIKSYPKWNMPFFSCISSWWTSQIIWKGN